MALTTEQLEIQEPASPTPSPEPSPEPSHRSGRAVAGWVVVAAALTAAGALAFSVLRTDDETPNPSNSLIERGSVAAIEQRVGVPTGSPSAPRSATNSLVERGSVTAIDHRYEVTSGSASVSGPVTNSLIERGSVRAIEAATAR